MRDRAKWRQAAHDWLQADLVAWTKTLESNSGMSRDLAKEMLTLACRAGLAAAPRC
jgi:hypothetical protein